MNLKMGPISRVVLLGGGRLLGNLALWCLKNGLNIKVITSDRQVKHEVDQLLTLGQFLSDNNIDHLVCNKLDSKEVEEFLSDKARSFYLSIGAPWIFNEETIQTLFDGQLLNLHGTRLPQNKGGGGFSWQIMTANRFGSTAIHLVDAGVDTGDIVDAEEFLYPITCRKPIDFEAYYISKCFDRISLLLTDIKAKERSFMRVPQNQSFSTYNPRLSSEINGWLDWSFNAWEIERLICAFDDPYEGVKTLVDSKKVFLKSASINLQDQVFHPYQAGIIYRKTKDWVCVASNQGSLIVEQVLDKNGKSYLHKLREGDRFSTPHEFLENSRQRVKYNPSGLVD